MNDGSDTAYYLHRGYRVIGIEADPVLAAACGEMFADEVRSGQLTILNVGIHERECEADFWVNDACSMWSSFDREEGCRDDTPCHAVPVRCLPFERILTEHGVPFYLKVDIESFDALCLQALSRDDLPAYVSAEAVGLDILCLLRSLGYNAFKCIPQRVHNQPPRPSLRKRFLTRLRRRVAHVLSKAPAVRGLARRLRSDLSKPIKPVPGPDIIRANRDREQWVFPHSSSGPFGEDTVGEWQSVEEVAYEWLHFAMGHPLRIQSALFDPWCDFHATRK